MEEHEEFVVAVPYHKPVLLSKVLGVLKEGVEAHPAGWVIDATLGDGGFTRDLIRLGANVLGIDVDPQAIDRAIRRFQAEGLPGSKFRLVQGNFRDLEKIISQTDLGDVSFYAILLDLGVSSLQLESPERGFSFKAEAPLDMRMDPTLAVRAADLVNGLNKGELYELFTKLGEEKFARRLADAVISARQVKPITTTRELSGLVEGVYQRHGIRVSKIHPATKAFQALRIAVNDELNALREFLPQGLRVLEKKGWIMIVSFHSLEDRIAKVQFKQWEKEGLGVLQFKKPIMADEEELQSNPRARSAKMRVFQKT